MKGILTALISLISISAFSQYKISVIAPQYKQGIAYLTYHMGKNLNLQDSGVVNNKGQVVFSGSKKLPGGIYSIVFPGKAFTSDFFVDKAQQIKISLADTLKPQDIVIEGSPENVLFEKYQKFIATKGPDIQRARQNFMTAKTAADSVKFEKEFNVLNNEISEYRNSIIKNNPESMMAALLLAMKESPYPTKVAVTRQDSIDNYNFYKSHYWDGITFMDDRIVRTPFFIPKFERYYRDVMPQSSDSIIKDIDYKLLLARSAPELYKFMLNWFTDEYINPKYMGQDAIFVHLFNKYHSKGLTPWLNEKQMEIITRRAYMQMANLIGEPASNLMLLDSTGKVRELYSLKSPYTVVIFWDPNCGHCKEELPRIDSVYRANWKKKGVKIYAVLTENHIPEWVNYIKKHDLGEWTHVYQSEEMAEAEKKSNAASYRQLYDVTQTPTVYLLDADKRIIGKKLTWEQINDLLEVKEKSKNTNEK